MGEPVAGTGAEAEAADIAAADVVDMVGSGAGRDGREDDADADAADAGGGDVIHESLDSGEAKTIGAPTLRTDDDENDVDDDADDAAVKTAAEATAAASADGRGVRNDGK